MFRCPWGRLRRSCLLLMRWAHLTSFLIRDDIFKLHIFQELQFVLFIPVFTKDSTVSGFWSYLARGRGFWFFIDRAIGFCILCQAIQRTEGIFMCCMSFHTFSLSSGLPIILLYFKCKINNWPWWTFRYTDHWQMLLAPFQDGSLFLQVMLDPCCKSTFFSDRST